MKRGIWFLLNPLNWFRAWRFHREQKKFDKSAYDLELYLNSNILKNDMLHYGYFDNTDVLPESISIQLLEEAQIRYAEKIIEKVMPSDEAVLDIGCGMGGLSALLLQKYFHAEALTPNVNQFQHIQKKYPALPVYHTKLENFQTEKKYGTLINAESLQYVRLDEAFKKACSLLLPGGKWIITDYFRILENTGNCSGHLLNDFLEKAAKEHWNIVEQEDMTPHILPTLKVIDLYVNRFLFPLKHFGLEKLRYKKAWLYFLTGKFRENAEAKMNKELMAVDPVRFAAEKKYMLFVLEKAK